MKRRKPIDGSFFGGLLAVRFGPDGLQAHVRAFLERLKEKKIEGSNSTLFDALTYIAACHAVDIPGLNENVLADLTSVPRDWVQSLVVRPLGEEATVASTAGYVFTRHRRVAAAIIMELETSLEKDLAELWRVLIQTTVKTGRDIYFGDKSFPLILHAGPRLQEALPGQLPKQRRIEIAIAAARASIAADSDRLSRIVDLGTTYRNAGCFPEAVSVFRENLTTAHDKIDVTEVIRGYWYEWGVCEGASGANRDNALASTWLTGLSLSDNVRPAPITEHDTRVSYAGLCLTFGKLAQPDLNCRFALGRRAVASLGKLNLNDPKAHWFDDYHKEADKISTPYPKDVEEAIAWLTTAVAQAGRELKDTFLSSLANPDEISFQKLQSILSKKKKTKK
jgi:hypothetical protein